MILAYFFGLILFFLPGYLVRFSILGLPTTLLELLIVAFLFAVIAGEVFRLPKNGGLKSSAAFTKIKKLGKINYAIAGFALAGIISTLVSPDKRAALGQLKAFILEPVLLFYASLLVIKTREQLDLVLRFLLASAALISIFGLIQYFTYIHLPLRFWGTGSEVERITSVFDYPNALSLFLAPLIGFFFTLWLNRYDLGLKKWLPAGLIVMTIGLLLTFSRGAWVAVGLAILALLLKQYGWKKIAPAVLLVGLILFFTPVVQQRVGLGLADPSSLAHADLWKFGLTKISQNPLLGNGLAGFATFNQGVSYPHNVFLNFWLEMGLLGLISFCSIIILAWQNYIKSPNTLKLASSIFLLILLIHGLVDVPYFKNDLSVLFWLILSFFYINVNFDL